MEVDKEKIMEDMKNLAIKKPKKETKKKETKKSGRKTKVVKQDDIEVTVEAKEKVEETVDIPQEAVKEDIALEDVPEEIEVVIEDEKTGGQEEKEIVDKKTENNKPKAKNKSFGDMFGYTWMGHGYTDKNYFT